MTVKQAKKLEGCICELRDGNFIYVDKIKKIKIWPDHVTLLIGTDWKCVKLKECANQPHDIISWRRVMDIEEYKKQALTTLSDSFHLDQSNVDLQHLLHGVLGLIAELGELVDPLKAHIFYGKELDVENLCEEFGDLNFFMAAIAHCLDTMSGNSWSDLLQANIEKLKKRYPQGFSEKDALERKDKKENK